MSFGARQLADRCIECEYRTLRLFCNLDESALRDFDQIGTHLNLPGHSIVFEESQPVHDVFVVCAGLLKLSATSREGRTMIVRIAGPGDVLGLSAVLSDLPHEVTAETLEPTQLKDIRRTEFLQFLETHAEVAQKAAKTLAKEYRAVFLDARRLALSGSAAGKLAQLLLDWANTASCGKPQHRFTMALTHEELANLAGTSRETVTRLLCQFERDGLITRHGSSLIILDSSGLGQLAQ